MIQGFYLTTSNCYGKPIAPESWEGDIKKGTPLTLCSFDEYGMEFSDGTNTFRLTKPCPIVPAASCPICGEVVPSNMIKDHQEVSENCKRVSRNDFY